MYNSIPPPSPFVQALYRKQFVTCVKNLYSKGAPFLAPDYPHPGSHSRLRQLLFPEPSEEARAHDDLRQQSDPEPRVPQTVQAYRQVREDWAGTRGVGGAGASDDGGDGPQNLRADQGEDDVEAGQRLQEDHAEADALDGVEGPEPEPEGPACEGAGERRAGPGHPRSHARDGPQHLAPPRGAEADGEHG